MSCLAGFDLAGYLYGWGFRPNMNAYVWGDAFNLRCLPTSGQVSITLDPLLSFVSSTPTPASTSGGTFTWNFSNLTNGYYNYWWNSFWANLVVHTSATAQIGDTVCITLTVNPLAGDSDQTNNTITKCWAVRNSWDPNDKAVMPQGEGTSGNIPHDDSTPMEYNIRFQNTGTDTAYSIFIIDTIDADLDINSLKVIASSHAMKVDILTGHVLKFSFNNIMLPDSGANEPQSHGFVAYSIHQKTNLTEGTQITNKAGIYFDFNPAVMTNTTLNTIASPARVEKVNTSDVVSIFPNPANEFITIQVPGLSKVQDLEIRDILGNKIQNIALLSNKKLNISGLSSGVYFVNLKVDGNSINRKIVVVK